MKPTKVLLVLILIFTFGCQPALSSTANTTSTPTSPSKTATPSRTPTKTPTLTSTPNPLFHTQCPEIVTEIPKSLELEGKIVLEGNPDNWGLFFFDPTDNTLKKYQITTSGRIVLLLPMENTSLTSYLEKMIRII